MADDDNFDIDIYGDDAPSYQDSAAQQNTPQVDTTMHTDPQPNQSTDTSNRKKENPDTSNDTDGAASTANGDASNENATQQISSTGASATSQTFLKQAPQQQGVKRKQGEDDDRPTDPGAGRGEHCSRLRF